MSGRLAWGPGGNLTGSYIDGGSKHFVEKILAMVAILEEPVSSAVMDSSKCEMCGGHE